MKHFVASHRRSGTHLTLDNLVSNFAGFHNGFANFDKTGISAEFSLYKTHIDGQQAADCLENDSQVIYVFRDGRDVMVSLYHYTISHDSKFKGISFSDFIRSPNPYNVTESCAGFDRIQYWNHHVQTWLQQKQFPILFLSFDRWKYSFEKILSEVEAFCGTKRNAKLKSMLRTGNENLAHRILRKIGLSGSTSVQFRGGRTSQWKDYFNEESLKYFDEISKPTMDLLWQQDSYRNSMQDKDMK